MKYIKSILKSVIKFHKFELISALLVLLMVFGSMINPDALAADQQTKDQMMKEKIHQLQELAPYRGYLDAHKDLQKPLGLLGGPIKIELKQDVGGVFVILPDNRKLDKNVFGTPEFPRAFGGSPGINGLPLMLRGVDNGSYTEMKKKSPFGDKYIVMPNGKLMINAVDATATDAAKSDDMVMMKASWQDKAGNTYEVKCCKMLATHGVETPTFGGVATNHILHGASRIGTSLMPTEFTYFDFWGMGQVLKNGKVLASPRLVHGMLTEYVRTKGYELAFDNEVTPTKLQFHLMVPPVMPVMKEGIFEHNPVNTGFELPNGMKLPFWHVMFENLKFEAKHS